MKRIIAGLMLGGIMLVSGGCFAMRPGANTVTLGVKLHELPHTDDPYAPRGENKLQGSHDSYHDSSYGLFSFVDRLKDLLPFAIVGLCYYEYPKQTMVVLTGLLAYVVYNSEHVRNVLRTYNIIPGAPTDYHAFEKVDGVDSVMKENTNAQVSPDKKQQVVIEESWFVYEDDGEIIEIEEIEEIEEIVELEEMSDEEEVEYDDEYSAAAPEIFTTNSY